MAAEGGGVSIFHQRLEVSESFKKQETKLMGVNNSFSASFFCFLAVMWFYIRVVHHGKKEQGSIQWKES
jgi:hypothetical protein